MPQRITALYVCAQILATAGAGPVLGDQPSLPETGPAELIVRVDDIGFCHGANMALKRVLESGVCTSVSLMVNSPWLHEAVAILKEHPEVSVGVHLTMNCEWREYRLGPVSPTSEVPSLVDYYGNFTGCRTSLMAQRPRLDEVERELRAQLELASRVGLRISYCDYHMSAAVCTREFQEIVERLAEEHQIGISRYFGEIDAPNVYQPDPDEKLARAIEIINELPQTGRHLIVFHPGTDSPEMAAMSDLNPTGPKHMSAHRQAETDVLCSKSFSEAIRARRFKLLGYKELQESELGQMKRQSNAPPYEEVVRKAVAAIKR
ncbi:MAG: ChbG/HpnK family deacetylase [bacterium]|nr:ChbG/HpnK family deacetylase [bacterium]